MEYINRGRAKRERGEVRWRAMKAVFKCGVLVGVVGEGR